jgi:hypothetical protein
MVRTLAMGLDRSVRPTSVPPDCNRPPQSEADSTVRSEVLVDQALRGPTGGGQRVPVTTTRRTRRGGPRLVLASTVGDRYRVRVADDGLTVRLWRLT